MTLDAPHVMPQRNGSNCGSRTRSFSKYRKASSLQISEKIEFLCGDEHYVAPTLIGDVAKSSWGSPLPASALALICALFSQSPSAGQIRVDQILSKVSATYQDAQTYRIVAENNVTVAAVGEGRSLNGSRAYSNYHKTTITGITLETSAPAKAWLAVKEENQELLS
jgi:hypothetical protein